MAKDAQTVSPWSADILLEVLQNSTEGVVLIQHGRDLPKIVYTNPQVTRLSGFSESQLLANGWKALCVSSEYSRALVKALNGGDSYLGMHEIACSDGSALRVIARLRQLSADIDGESLSVLQLVSASHQSSGDLDFNSLLADLDLAPNRERFGRLDKVDGSSGLLRFDRFQEILDRDLAIACREKRPVSLMALHILEFQEYRNTFGANAADSCLRMIGKQVTATLRRATDLCARYADDTILIAVFGQDADQAGPLIEKISENIEGLKIHNPRGRLGRYLTVGCATVEIEASAFETESSGELVRQLVDQIPPLPQLAQSI